MELNLTHKPAAHCENGSISSLLRFYGINMSEPMIFGLASGLFFSHMPFVKLSGMPVTSFRTFPGVLFKRITKILGIKAHSRRFLNKEKAMDALDHLLINEGKPVGCVVGMYYLPYIPIEYRFHFNGHNICIIGKDEKTDTYIVLDSNTTQKAFISRKDLIKVRFAKGGTYPLYGLMYWIESVPESMPDLTPLIKKAIRKTCKNMIANPPFVYFAGVNGIRFLSNRIRKWDKEFGEHGAILNLAQIIRMQEEIGTGGAGFRFMYGAFLQEAAKTTGLEALNDFSIRITNIGDKWREFAYDASRICKRRNGEDYSYETLGNKLQEIANLENAFFHDLYDFIKRC